MIKKKEKQIYSGKVIIPVGYSNQPEPHEEDVAKILARHFMTSVKFLMPIDDYKRKTADIKMLGVNWEIKCPKGNSKSTIRNQFRRASGQSKNIIIDTRRTKLKYKNIEKSVLFELSKRPYVKRLILIDQSENVIEILR